MLTFRQKIFFSYVIVFLLFIVLMIGFTQMSVRSLITKMMKDRADEVVAKIKIAPDDPSLVQLVKEQKALAFFRISIISDTRKILYDTHAKPLLGPAFSQEYQVSHPEVTQAMKEGIGYHEEYSELLHQDLAYMAKAFDFHGKKYILRIAFPLEYVNELKQELELGFLAAGSLVLLLSSIFTWFLISYLTSPIQQIISGAEPYKEGRASVLPKLPLKLIKRDDEFGRLANTLNSLSTRIQQQIDTLTFEQHEKEIILQSLVEGVVALDENMVVTYANGTATTFLKMPLEKLVGEPFKKSGQETLISLLEFCQKAKKPLQDTLEIKRGRKRLYLDVVAAPKKDERGAILVLQDKTEHYRILERQRVFIANASHKLRTPITVIRGFVETLKEYPKLPKETLEDIFEKVVRNCQKMNQLIRNLLTLADIEHVPPSRVIECDLYDLILHSSDVVRENYPEAKIVVQKEEELTFLGDPNLLELAFVNLIENGAKYSHPPAKIAITLKREGKWIKVAIQDEGIGIPKEELENIFQRFYTVDKTLTQKVGGFGLGLAIVETVLEKHGGKILVESEVDKGSTFTLLFPKQQREK